MKKAITVLFFFVSLSAFSQHNTASLPGKADSSRWYEISIPEDEMVQLYNLMIAAKSGFGETDFTGKQIKVLARFADTMTARITVKYNAWHPAPPPVPKTDSTSTPKK